MLDGYRGLTEAEVAIGHGMLRCELTISGSFFTYQPERWVSFTLQIRRMLLLEHWTSSFYQNNYLSFFIFYFAVRGWDLPLCTVRYVLSLFS